MTDTLGSHRRQILTALENAYFPHLAEDRLDGTHFDHLILDDIKRRKEDVADRIVLAMIHKDKKEKHSTVVVLGVSLSTNNMDFPTALQLRSESDESTICRSFGKNVWERCIAAKIAPIEVEIPASKEKPNYLARVYQFPIASEEDGYLPEMKSIFADGAKIRRSQPDAVGHHLSYDAEFGKNAGQFDDMVGDMCYGTSYCRGVKEIAQALHEKGLIN